MIENISETVDDIIDTIVQDMVCESYKAIRNVERCPCEDDEFIDEVDVESHRDEKHIQEMKLSIEWEADLTANNSKELPAFAEFLYRRWLNGEMSYRRWLDAQR